MAITISDPAVKMGITVVQMGVDQLAAHLKAKYAADHKKVDAVTAAQAAIDAALSALESL